MSAEEWKRAVVILEEERICEEERQYLRLDRQELEKQNTLLKENMDLSQKIIDQYKISMDTQDRACKQALKEAKPSITQRIGEAVIYIGIGVGIVLLL